MDIEELGTMSYMGPCLENQQPLQTILMNLALVEIRLSKFSLTFLIFGTNGSTTGLPHVADLSD